MNKLLTFDYFSKQLLDPMFEVFRVLDDINHPENKKLILDLNNISKQELENMRNMDFYLDRFDDKDIGRRAYCLVYLLHKTIAINRINRLMESMERPAPYNSENLKQLPIDKNNLTPINEFNTDNFGFEKNGFVYTLCPILEQSNSSYWIFQAILKFAKERNINFKVRLDPFIEISLNKYRPMFYKMLVHGKQLDWQKLLNLKNDDFGQWFDEKDYNRMGFTDYVWSPKDSEVHFTCEELPKNNFKGNKTTRYFHAIFNKNTGEIKHCDGAIRFYTQEEFNNRSSFHIKDTEVRKAGKRIKIFQYESKENNNKEIDQDTFCLLATNFFVWNADVQTYFN